MAGYYSRPAQLARQMRQLLFPRRCPCCRRVLGTLPLCEVCTPRLEELRRGPVMRLDVSRHYLGALDGAAAPYRYEGVVRSAILRAKYEGESWTAVELGVEMTARLFGAEVEMHFAEPVPGLVPGAASVMTASFRCLPPAVGAATMCRSGWRSLWPMRWVSRCCQRRSAASGPDVIRQDSRWTSVWQMRPVPSGHRNRNSWKGSGCCWWMTSSPPALPPQPVRRHCWMRAPTASLPWQWQSPKMKWTHHRELLDDERKIQKKSKKNKKSA